MSTITVFIIIVCLLLLAWSFTYYTSRKTKQELLRQLTHYQGLNQQAEQAKATAEAANLAKNRYLSGISHELRTPLNVIMGYAQLLEKNTSHDDPNARSYHLIYKNSEHLSHLIEGILEFSAIESGKLKVQADVIDLHDILDQITQMFAAQAQQKGLQFYSELPKHLPQFVKTDPKRLKQILINILSNAIKFTQQGHVNFIVSYRNQITTFKISDSGCGISKTDINRIFQPFERVQQPRNNTPGTGLGLTIAKLLSQLLGGELTVQSEPGRGTEFILKLMLSQQTALNHQNELSLNTDQQQHKLLIVDDETEHRELLNNILAPLGFEILQAANSQQAKQLIKNSQIDLAFFDIAMPDEDGWQLAAWCREHHHTFKIVMVSANPRDAESQKNMHHQAYITKPVQINQLLAILNQLLNLGWEHQKSPAHEPPNTEIIKLKRKHRLALKQMIDIGHINGIENYLQSMQDKQLISRGQLERLLEPVKQLNLSTFSKITGIDD